MSTNKFVSMTNIFSEPVRIEIGGSPGEGVTEYVIQPGDAREFQMGYCVPVPSAGPEMLPSILSRKSMRTWPDGVRRPTLIPTEEYVKAKAKAKAGATTTGAAAR